MKADARPSREEEPLEFAANFFRKHKSWFSSTQGNWLGSKAILAKQPPDVQQKLFRGLGKLALIDGDIRAIEMLCDMAARHLAEKKEMPESLRIFTCLFLTHPFTKWRGDGERLVPGEKIKSKPGPHSRDRSNRNQAICVIIEAIRYQWGFGATRSPASKDSAKRSSAVSIVRDALEKGGNINLTEAAVNKIWNDWGDKGESFEDFMARTSRKNRS
jgi:hypothetical protein